MTEIKKDDLEKVSGGVIFHSEDGQGYQLYYHEEALPMDSTVEQLCKQYDGMETKLKKALGLMLYAMIAKKTLNELCTMVDPALIQEKLNEN